MAKNRGKIFEDLIKESALLQGIDYTRFIDAGFGVSEAGFKGDSGVGKRFTPSNLVDCLLFGYGYLRYIEAKSSKDRFTLNRISDSKVKKLNAKQELLDSSEATMDCCAIGFMLEYYKGSAANPTDLEYFYVPWPKLNVFIKAGNKSLNRETARAIGTKITTYLPTTRSSKRRLDLSVL